MLTQADKISKVSESSRALMVRGPQAINFTSHALQRMAERNVNMAQVQRTFQTANPFQYFHDGALKTGYYDQVSRIFVGEIAGTGKITTVITNITKNYINNLRNTLK